MKYRKKRKSFRLRDEILIAWNFIKESRNYIYFAIALFVLSAIFGYAFPQLFEESILKIIQDLISKTQGMGFTEITGYIFLNNLQSAFFAMFFGILLGVVPLANAVLNGYLIGFVANHAIAEEGILVLWRLLPHGVFELPALFIAIGIGLKLGSFIFHKKKIETLGDYFFKALKVFFYIVVPLLVIAAIIEGFLISFFS